MCAFSAVGEHRFAPPAANTVTIALMAVQFRCLASQGTVSRRNFLAIWKGSRCLISIVATIALTVPPCPVFAGILDSTFNVEAQVGLDEPTRKLIQGFPKEIRDQVLSVLTTALPLIKKDVNEYIDKINSLLTEQIANVQCAGGGLAKGVMDQLARTIGVSPQPIENLQGDWSKTVQNFKISSKPGEYANRYADFTYRAALTRCQMQISPVAVRAREFEDKGFRRFTVWARLDSRCADSKDCFAKLYDETKHFLSISDRRDVLAGHGQERFAKLVEPKPPLYQYVWGFDPVPFEDALTELFAIGDRVQLAKAGRELKEREAKAQVLIGRASAEIDQAKAEMVVAFRVVSEVRPFFSNGEVMVSEPKMIADANAHADSAVQHLNQANKDLDEALKLDPNVAASAAQIRSLTGGVQQDINAIREKKPGATIRAKQK
jgi:hypothetical protein